MTTSTPLTPVSRRLLSCAALSIASLAWGQDAPTAETPLGQGTAPAATISPAQQTTTPTTSDHILPAADPASPAATTLAGVLSGNSTAVSAIQRQEFAVRDQLLGEISDRVQLANRRISELQQSSGSLDDPAKKALETAVADYNRSKARLEQSLEASRSAQANTWERARSGLASDYAFWVAAAASVELASPK